MSERETTGERPAQTEAILCAYPGCENVAEIIPVGQRIPAGAIGRKQLMCHTHTREQQTEPLSAARLAEIRQRVSQAEDHRANGYGYMLLTGEFGYALDGRDLLAEVDRLRAALAQGNTAIGWAQDVADARADALAGERDSYRQVASGLMRERDEARSALAALTQREDAEREIVRAVADGGGVCLCNMSFYPQAGAGAPANTQMSAIGTWNPEWDGKHQPSCLVGKARAVLAGERGPQP